MEYQEIALEVNDRTAVLTLDRPQALNAFTDQMLRELLHAFDRIDMDDQVRAVIVTGRGRAFCAGANLSQDGATLEPAQLVDRPTRRDTGGVLALRVFNCTKPVIAAINGPAVGVGATMTLPMDVRLASESARLGFVFVKRGIIPEACSSWFLPRIVGISTAVEWISTGRIFPARTEGVATGLVRSVHPDDQLLAAAHGLADEIASSTSAISVALSRRLLWRMLGAPHPMDAHRAESIGIAAMGSSDEAREGVSSFLEKRAPNFPGRVSAGLPNLFPGWTEPTFG